MTLVSNHISVAELTTLEEWDAISQLWDDLFVKCPEASIFNSYSYLRCLYTNFFNRHSCRLAVLILKDETDTPIGAAPMIRLKRWMTGFPVDIISLMYHQVITDRIQFLLPNRRDELLQAIFMYIQENSNNWDVLVLQEQDIDIEYESIISSVFKDSCIFYRDLNYPQMSPFLKMDFGSDGWEKYLLTRSKKHRKNWRYLQNRITSQGKVTVTRHTGDEDLIPLLTEFQKLEDKSRKVGGKHSLSPEIFKFYQDLSSTLIPNGSMHFAFLRLDGIPIAGVIGMSFNDRYVGLQTTFDENFSDHSPGFLVCGYDIKWAMENGFSEFDFMSGSISNKMQWTDSRRKHQVLRIFKKRAFSGFFYLSKFRIVPVFRQVFEKLGLIKSAGKISGYENSSLCARANSRNLQLDGCNDELPFPQSRQALNHRSKGSEQ